MKVQRRTLEIATGLVGIESQMKCKVCGQFCREVSTAKHKKAWKCDECGVKYFERNPDKYEPHKMLKYDYEDKKYKFVDKVKKAFRRWR